MRESFFACEQKMSTALRPLAHYYGVLAQCVESGICSARAAFGYLCADATERYFGVKIIREYVLDRLRWEMLGISLDTDSNSVQKKLEEGDASVRPELDKRRLDMERNPVCSKGLELLLRGVSSGTKTNRDARSKSSPILLLFIARPSCTSPKWFVSPKIFSASPGRHIALKSRL